MTAKSLSLITLALLFCAGAAYAVHWGIEEWRYRALLADRALSAGDRDASVKPEAICPDPADSLAFVIFGQSNAANHGAVRLSAPDGTFDFYDGRCFSGNDPQFSATSNGGSPWPAFAEALREGGEERPILWANVAVGNTRADEWLPGTPNAVRLQSEAVALQKNGYRIAAFLFFQGESDQSTQATAYQKSLTEISEMIEETAPGTPFILSHSSICGVGTQPVSALVQARTAVARSRQHVHIGPDTDTLGQDFRVADGCHFNEAGLRAAGRLWATSVRDIISVND